MGDKPRKPTASNYLDDPLAYPSITGRGRNIRPRSSFSRNSADMLSASAAETRRRRERREREFTFPVGPGGVVRPEEETPSVPIGVAAGADRRPFGRDFAAWHEATRNRAPAYLTGDDEPPPDDVRFAWGEDTELLREGRGGEAWREPYPGPSWPQAAWGPQEPPDAPPGSFRRRNFEEDWIEARAAAADARARERWRRGQPDVIDFIFMAVFGRRTWDEGEREREED
jgi:hypothetical protein